MMKPSQSLSVPLLLLSLVLSLTLTASTADASIFGKSSSSSSSSAAVSASSTPDIPVANLANIALQVMKMELRYGNGSDPKIKSKHQSLMKKYGLKREYEELVQREKKASATVEPATSSATSATKLTTKRKSSKATTATTSSSKAKGKAASTTSSTSTGTASKSGASTVDFPLNIEVSSTGSELETNAKFVLGGKEYLMTVDSGSVIPWIEGSAGYPAAGSNLTKAVQQDGSDAFTLQYGIGNVTGTLYRDDVTLSGTNLKVSNLTIGSSKTTSSNFVGDSSKGVLGLGFSRLSPTAALSKNPTFMDLLFSENPQLAKKEACFALKRENKNDTFSSTVRFGGSDASLKDGKMSTYAVNRTLGYWQMAIDSFSVASAGSGIEGQAIIDTATSFIPAGWSGVDAFWGNVENSAYNIELGAYTYPCDQKLDVKLKMPDGVSFPIAEEDMNLGRASPGSDRCIGAVLPLATEGVTVLGLSVLKNLYFCLQHEDGAQGAKIRLAKAKF